MVIKEDVVKKLGSILGIWAHPDDETWASAGIMATAVQNSQKVICISATKGEEGVQDENRWPKHRLHEIRENELQKSLSCLGADIEHHWLGYLDGALNSVNIDEAIYKIISLLPKRTRIDTILTFGPDGLTGHPDHKVVSGWASKLAKRIKVNEQKIYHLVESQVKYDKYLELMDKDLNMYFNIDKPPLRKIEELDLCYKLEDQILKKKIEALRCQESQTSKLFEMYGEDHLKKVLETECFVLKKVHKQQIPKKTKI